MTLRQQGERERRLIDCNISGAVGYAYGNFELTPSSDPKSADQKRKESWKSRENVRV